MSCVEEKYQPPWGARNRERGPRPWAWRREWSWEGAGKGPSYAGGRTSLRRGSLTLPSAVSTNPPPTSQSAQGTSPGPHQPELTSPGQAHCAATVDSLRNPLPVADQRGPAAPVHPTPSWPDRSCRLDPLGICLAGEGGAVQHPRGRWSVDFSLAE